MRTLRQINPDYRTMRRALDETRPQTATVREAPDDFRDPVRTSDKDATVEKLVHFPEAGGFRISGKSLCCCLRKVDLPSRGKNRSSGTATDAPDRLHLDYGPLREPGAGLRKCPDRSTIPVRQVPANASHYGSKC